MVAMATQPLVMVSQSLTNNDIVSFPTFLDPVYLGLNHYSHPFAGFITKCIQLYDTTVVRHGLMLVGPTCSGKTKCYEVLAKCLTNLKGQPSISGGVYEAVHVSSNPARGGN